MTDRLTQSELDMTLFRLLAAQRRVDMLASDPSSSTLERREATLEVEKIKERIEVLRDKLGYDDGSPLVSGASFSAPGGSWTLTVGGSSAGASTSYAAGGWVTMSGGGGGGGYAAPTPGYTRSPYTVSTSEWRHTNGVGEPVLEDNGIVSWSREEGGWLPFSGNWILVYACGCRRTVHRSTDWTLEALDALRVSDEFATCSECFEPYVEMIEVSDGE